MSDTVRIGTRGSQLALWQANWVASDIKARHPSLSPELVIIKTRGDRIQNIPLAQIGGKALFIKEIEEALLDRRIDVAVHSMKDMPGAMPDGLTIGAIPQREITADVLISRDGRPLSDLSAGSKVGTGSLRRTALLRHARPDLQVVPLRGNLDTRLKKLDAEDMDAIVLAAAGIRRLGWGERITEYLDASVMLPAVGQGALCIQTRENDSPVDMIVREMDHGQTRTSVTGERALLTRLNGSCRIPIAALGKIDENQLILDGLVADADGKTVIRDMISGPESEAESIGIRLAETLLSMGADAVLREFEEKASDNNEG